MVISIIGMLSAVMLASLSTARQKANDAAIQSDMETIQTQAEIFFYGAGNNSYAGPTSNSACSGASPTMWDKDTTMKNALHALWSLANGGQSGVMCYSNTTTYAMSVQLNAPSVTTFWCIDSTGKAGTTTAAVSAPNC